METKIKKLEDSLISKIAAGEVIDRPASIVKELVENSIDSGATQITINVANAGKTMISISDNGCGMTHDDAILSFERHTTSKIHDVNDLFAINTLGFRGEALASIASVSKIEMITNTKGALATKIEIIGGKITNTTTAGAPKGTQIKVENIFFNTPARKKYMKSDAIELEHIIDILTRYSLANSKIHFKFSSNNREIIVTPGTDNLLSNIRNIYGKETEKNIIEINNSVENITVTGYISKPALTRGTKDHQSIFVNGRYIKNKIVTDSIYNAYKTLLPKHRHPFFVLFIKLDPKTIDVNIHPSKKEIKVRNDIEENLSNAVYLAANNALNKNTLIPDATITNKDMQYNHNNNTSKRIPKAKNSYNIPQGTQSTLRPSHAIIPETITKTNNTTETNNKNNNSYIIKEQSKSYNEIKKTIEQKESINTNHTNRLPEMKIIGQINKTYIIAETTNGMLIIDQHAAHERVFYEKFMNMYNTSNIKTQNLLSTQIIELPAKESLILSSNIDEFKKYGFNIETFGNNTFIIRTVPIILGKIKSKEMLKEIIDDFINLSKTDKISKITISKIISMACRAAIKGGDELNTHTIKTLINDLSKTNNPFTCPHGRPTIINISISELEKKFKRVV